MPLLETAFPFHVIPFPLMVPPTPASRVVDILSSPPFLAEPFFGAYLNLCEPLRYSCRLPFFFPLVFCFLDASFLFRGLSRSFSSDFLLFLDIKWVFLCSSFPGVHPQIECAPQFPILFGTQSPPPPPLPLFFGGASFHFSSIPVLNGVGSNHGASGSFFVFPHSAYLWSCFSVAPYPITIPTPRIDLPRPASRVSFPPDLVITWFPPPSLWHPPLPSITLSPINLKDPPHDLGLFL